MASITMEMDFPEEIAVRGYERIDQGHAFEVDWEWPERCSCGKCGREGAARIERKNTVYTVRDLDVWGQPAFFVYQPPYHLCSACGHRQHLTPPFKRPNVTYTYRFEREVLACLIGSTMEEVARRLAISAETVELIVENQLADEKQIAPGREIRDVGLDEISLKKRHKLYVTILTDLTNPGRPQVLAVASGRDRAAAVACLERLTSQQRRQIHTHRTDMGSAYPAACQDLLPNSRLVVDRFHVAKRLGEVVDELRKKNHSSPQERSFANAAEAVS